MMIAEKTWLEMFIGPMRSNKTGEFFHRIRTVREFGKKHVLVIKPSTDTKSAVGFIETRNNGGERLEAHELGRKNLWDIAQLLKDEELTIGKKIDCIAIDEGQFFQNLFQVVDALLRAGYNILVAGLDRDFIGEPFGDMLALTCFAADSGEIRWCIAYCTECGQKATLSQRLLADGSPAPYDSPIIIPGESYEPRCQEHFILPGRRSL